MRGKKGNRNRPLRKVGGSRWLWRQAVIWPLVVAVVAVLLLWLLAAAAVGGARFVAGQPTVQSAVAQVDWWLHNTTPPQVRLTVPAAPVR